VEEIFTLRTGFEELSLAKPKIPRLYNKVLSVIINVDLIFFVDSYDDRATTQKILQKLNLENFQVCFL
jgi:hypothetical protein